MTPPPPAPLLPPPAGYTGGVGLPSAVVQKAVEVLNTSSLGYGDTVTQDYNGIAYIHRIEPHYDDHVGGYLHWHRGVTVYQPIGTTPAKPPPSPPKPPPTPSDVPEPVEMSLGPKSPRTWPWLFMFSAAVGFSAVMAWKRR